MLKVARTIRYPDGVDEIVNAPKTATFQMRINPEIKNEAERVFSRCGLSFTDAVNLFLQQSINAGGLQYLLIYNISKRVLDT